MVLSWIGPLSHLKFYGILKKKREKRKYFMVKLYSKCFLEIKCSSFLSPFSSLTLNFTVWVCVLFLFCFRLEEFFLFPVSVLIFLFLEVPTLTHTHMVKESFALFRYVFSSPLNHWWPLFFPPVFQSPSWALFCSCGAQLKSNYSSILGNIYLDDIWSNHL